MLTADQNSFRPFSTPGNAVRRKVTFAFATLSLLQLLPAPLLAQGILVDPAEIVATASSTLPPPADRSSSYDASNTLDGNLGTGWSEGAIGPGIGESLTYQFSKPMRISRVEIVNGFAKSPTLFSANARIRDAQIFTNFGAKEVTLNDSSEWQTIIPNAGPTDVITLDVLSVYEGTSYEDLVVSEIRFFREADFSSAAEVGGDGSSPLLRRDAPPEYVASQLELYVGAGPGEACFDADQPQAGVVVDPATIEIGLFSNLCFTGFDVKLPITVEIQAPDGSAQTATFAARYSHQQDTPVFFWFWPARPGMGAGGYRITALQGNRQATGVLQVRPASSPRLRVVPFDLHDVSAGDLPPVATQPGADFEILLAGFPSNAAIALHVYGARDAGSVSYLTTVQVSTDKNGQAIYRMAAPTTGGDGVYCLGIDPEHIARYYRSPEHLNYDPDYRPDAQHVCFDTWFGVGKAYWGG